MTQGTPDLLGFPSTDALFADAIDRLDRASRLLSSRHKVECWQDTTERPPDSEWPSDTCPNCVTPWKCNGPHIPLGPALRDAGIAQTIAAEPPSWLQDALDRLRGYAAEHPRGEFTGEDFRRFWAATGRPAPHSPHVWGALFNRAASAGVIRATGRYVRAKSARTRAHPVQVWVAA